jgi:hypothetical protein
MFTGPTPSAERYRQGPFDLTPLPPTPKPACRRTPDPCVQVAYDSIPIRFWGWSPAPAAPVPPPWTGCAPQELLRIHRPCRRRQRSPPAQSPGLQLDFCSRPRPRSLAGERAMSTVPTVRRSPPRVAGAGAARRRPPSPACQLFADHLREGERNFDGDAPNLGPLWSGPPYLGRFLRPVTPPAACLRPFGRTSRRGRRSSGSVRLRRSGHRGSTRPRIKAAAGPPCPDTATSAASHLALQPRARAVVRGRHP